MPLIANNASFGIRSITAMGASYSTAAAARAMPVVLVAEAGAAPLLDVVQGTQALIGKAGKATEEATDE